MMGTDMMEHDDLNWVVELRRRLHSYPEPSGHEVKTAKKVAEVLKSLDCRVITGVAGHGVVGVLEGGRPGFSVAFRAELDALPVEEVTGVLYRSRHSGYMHACGHDAHMAIALGAARVLSKRREYVTGRILFIFEPAEEAAPVGGAASVMDYLRSETLLPDRIYALHVWPDLPAGSIGLRAGPIMAASDRFEATFRGSGGHAGIPQNISDPVLAASFFVSMSQALLHREKAAEEKLAYSVGVLEGAQTANVVPATVRVAGSVRTFQETVRAKVQKRLRDVAAGVGRATGLRWRLAYSLGYPVVSNDPEEAKRVAEVASRFLGDKAIVWHEPVFMADDFGRYLEAIPGCLVLLGCGGPGGRGALHRPDFALDEECLQAGVRLWVALAAPQDYMSLSQS